jgi:hypothetical protein
MLAAIWDKAKGGNLGAIREVIRISERRSKLLGLDAPVRVDVAEGISEAEFAEQAAALLRITGDAPLRELAKLPPAPGEPHVVDCYSDGWANIGPCVDDTPTAATGFVPAEPEAELCNALHSCEDDEPGQHEEVQAELVEANGIEVVVPPLPPSQRRIAADQVLGSAGVPTRASLSGRRSGERYDPLAGAGFGEILQP